MVASLVQGKRVISDRTPVPQASRRVGWGCGGGRSPAQGQGAAEADGSEQRGRGPRGLRGCAWMGQSSRGRAGSGGDGGWGRAPAAGRGRHPCRGQRQSWELHRGRGGPAREDRQPGERLRRERDGDGDWRNYGSGAMGGPEPGRRRDPSAGDPRAEGGRGEAGRRGGGGGGGQGRVRGTGPGGTERQRRQK